MVLQGNEKLNIFLLHLTKSLGLLNEFIPRSSERVECIKRLSCNQQRNSWHGKDWIHGRDFGHWLIEIVFLQYAKDLLQQHCIQNCQQDQLEGDIDFLTQKIDTYSSHEESIPLFPVKYFLVLVCCVSKHL